MVNNLAVALGADLAAGVPFYGAAPATADVPKIKAPLLIQYAGTDERINAMWPEYEAALKANNVAYEMHIYEGTQHGFHSNSTPRYNEAAANLARSARSRSSSSILLKPARSSAAAMGEEDVGRRSRDVRFRKRWRRRKRIFSRSTRFPTTFWSAALGGAAGVRRG